VTFGDGPLEAAPLGLDVRYTFAAAAGEQALAIARSTQ